MIPYDFPPCYHSSIRHLVVLFIHLIAVLTQLFQPGGVRSLVAESLLLKHQLLIVNRSRQRSPNLSSWDRILAGALDPSYSSSPCRDCTEAFYPASPSQSHEQAKVPHAVFTEPPSEARSQRRTHPSIQGRSCRHYYFSPVCDRSSRSHHVIGLPPERRASETATTQYTIQIAEPVAITTSPNFPNACVGQPYSFTAKTTGEFRPFNLVLFHLPGQALASTRPLARGAAPRL